MMSLQELLDELRFIEANESHLLTRPVMMDVEGEVGVWSIDVVSVDFSLGATCLHGLQPVE